MEIGKLLEYFEDLEIRMATMYRVFRHQFLKYPEAADLFEKLAEEEDEHRDIVRMQQSMVRQGLLRGDLDLDLSDLDTIMDQAADLAAGDFVLPLKDAIALAVEFERQAAEYHYRTAAGRLNPDVGEMLKTLGSCDKCHMEKLVQFATTRGYMPD